MNGRQIAVAAWDAFHRKGIIQRRGIRTPQAYFLPDLEPTQQDVQIAERLLAAYVYSPPHEDIWGSITSGLQGFAAVVDRADPLELARYLCNVSRMDASRGIVQGDIEHQKLKLDPTYRRHVARMAADKLLLVAEAVGAVPVENPEQGPRRDTAKMTSGQIVDAISSVMSIDITPPEIDGGLFKIRTGVGDFGERDLNALYTAWLLRNYRSVCEIGGGSGRVAYWALRLGVRHYTIIDLPHANMLQGFYLMKALGADSVSLHGEDGRAPITLTPSSVHKSVGIDADAILNQDSFPEIAADVVRGYLEWVKNLDVPLISINHESQPPSGIGAPQIRVSDLVAEVGGFERTERHLYWLRSGYVLERFEPKSGSGHATHSDSPSH